jgi:hypothetical protein
MTFYKSKEREREREIDCRIMRYSEEEREKINDNTEM